MRNARFTRVTASMILLVPFACAIAACFSSSVLRPDEIEQAQIRKGDQLRLTYAGGTVLLGEAWTVNYPFVEGLVDDSKGTVPSESVAGTERRRFNVEDALKIEVMSFSRGRTVALAGGVPLAVTLLGLVLIFAALSCPHVYVGTGAEAVLVGEAYPGAMLGTMQRTDFLALPPPPAPGVPTSISLRNEHRERQFVDSVGMALVHHTERQRAVATIDGVVVVDELIPLTSATANGSDVVKALQRSDGDAWLSTPGVAPARSGDRLEVSFDVRTAGDYVLVITAENTHWHEATVAHAIRQSGSAYASLITQSNAEARSALHRWREAAGFDLLVENDARAWKIPPFGTAGFRTAAVADARVKESGRVSFVLRSDAHHWRMDSIVLMRVAERSPHMTLIEPTCQRRACADSLRARDGRYVELTHRGDRLDLEFAASRANVAGTAFLVSSGYYTIDASSNDRSTGLHPLRAAADDLAATLRGR